MNKVKPFSMKRILRIANGKEPLTLVDSIITKVNAALGSQASLRAHQSSPSVGQFWQVGGDAELTPEEVLALDKAFLGAGWGDVQVNHFHGRWSVSLASGSTRGWTPVFNGKPLTRQPAA